MLGFHRRGPGSNLSYSLLPILVIILFIFIFNYSLYVCVWVSSSLSKV